MALRLNATSHLLRGARAGDRLVSAGLEARGWKLPGACAGGQLAPVRGELGNARDVSGANVRDANVRHANVRHANVRHANVRDANVRHAKDSAMNENPWCLVRLDNKLLGHEGSSASEASLVSEANVASKASAAGVVPCKGCRDCLCPEGDSAWQRNKQKSSVVCSAVIMTPSPHPAAQAG